MRWTGDQTGEADVWRLICRVAGAALALLAPFSGASSSDANPVRSEFVRRLEAGLSAGRFRWIAGEVEVQAESAQNSPWRKIHAEFPLGGASLALPLPELPLPAEEPRANSAAQENAESTEEVDEAVLANTVSSQFLSGSDTLRFTMGRVPEAISASPMIRWRDSRGRSRQDTLTIAYNYNVCRVWMTRCYLVFGLEARYEFGDQDARLAFWNSSTGEWAVSPFVASGKYDRAGSYLAKTLPDWQSAGMADSADMVVLRGGARSICFWPSRHKWALCDASGIPLSLPARNVRPRWMYDQDERRFHVSDEARTAIRGSMMRQAKGLDSLLILEEMDHPCGDADSGTVVLATVARATDWRMRRALPTPAIFGVFLLRHRQPARPVGFLRAWTGGDGSVEFDPDSPADSIVVVGAEGQGWLRKSFACPRDSASRPR